GLVVDRTEDVGRGLDVFDHQVPKHVLGLLAGAHQLDHRLVVVRRAADRLVEDGRVRGHTGHALVAQARKLAGRDQLTADVVQPERLADLAQLSGRVGPGCGYRGHHFVPASLVAAATICLTEIPAAFMSSSGLPDSGRPLTARCASRTGGSMASASSTAAPSPPSG